MELNGTYSGNLDWNGLEVCYTVDVACDYSFQKGRMYMPNGDPGYPDEEEYEDARVVDVAEVAVFNIYGDEVTDKYTDDEELRQAIIKDAENDEDYWVWDDPDCDYEPDYDDFENPEWKD